MAVAIVTAHTHTHTLTDPTIMERILKENPDQMIKFKVYKREYMPQVATIDRRLTRIKNKNKLPIPVWANLVVESILGFVAATLPCLQWLHCCP